MSPPDNPEQLLEGANPAKPASLHAAADPPPRPLLPYPPPRPDPPPHPNRSRHSTKENNKKNQRTLDSKELGPRRRRQRAAAGDRVAHRHGVLDAMARARRVHRGASPPGPPRRKGEGGGGGRGKPRACAGGPEEGRKEGSGRPWPRRPPPTRGGGWGEHSPGVAWTCPRLRTPFPPPHSPPRHPSRSVHVPRSAAATLVAGGYGRHSRIGRKHESLGGPPARGQLSMPSGSGHPIIIGL